MDIKAYQFLPSLDLLRLSKDLLLYSKDEFEELSEDETALCYRVKREGLQIYAKD